MTPGIYLAQVVCPDGHCMMALVGPCDDEDELCGLAGLLGQTFKKSCACRYAACAVCYSIDLHIETMRTPLTMADGDLVAEVCRRAGKAEWN